MKYFLKAVLLILISFSISGCLELFQDGSDIPEQEIYFQYEYTNEAWGHQHSGWLIDSTGEVHCYALPENWNYPDSSGYIDAAALSANISMTDAVCYSIDRSVLRKKVQRIENASGGELSEPRNEMYDAGSTSFYAFVYEKEKDRYKRVLLRQNGDWQIDNSSRDAELLYAWLEDILQEINTQ